MDSSRPIYMDNHATTRVDPRVVEAMLPYFDREYGNAGSVVHPFGDHAREAVRRSRAAIASALNADPTEIVFTSGATESNNLALRGVADRARRRGNHLVSVRTEHRAVLDPLARLGRKGCEVTLLDVEQHGSPRAGYLDPERVRSALRPETALVSVMLANNEIGVIQPVAEIAAVCREHGVIFHCDATQGVGKIPVDLAALGVDLLSFSAHKIYGPKGIGVLYVRRHGDDPPVRLEAQITGGGQQDNLRAGTLNVPGIVGLARALELCVAELPTEMERLERLRDRLWHLLQARIPDVQLCGPALEARDEAGEPLRLPGNLDVAFEGVQGEALLLQMVNLAVSSGAACSSTEPEPSHVLLALGMSEDAARSTLRFGLGRFNSEAEVEAAATIVAEAVARLRTLA